MLKLRISSVVPAVLALMIGTGTVYGGTSDLTLSTHTVNLTYVIGAGTSQATLQSTIDYSATPDDAFTVDASGSAAWLAAPASSGSSKKYAALPAIPAFLASSIMWQAAPRIPTSTEIPHWAA